eukprot:13548196-Alexandrium_andersonii.AAC.2
MAVVLHAWRSGIALRPCVGSLLHDPLLLFTSSLHVPPSTVGVLPRHDGLTVCESLLPFTV